MPAFRHTRTGRVLDIPETATSSYRRSDAWEEIVDTPEPAESVGHVEEDGESQDDRPLPTDRKDAWVAWADSRGHDTEGLTKAELQELE